MSTATIAGIAVGTAIGGGMIANDLVHLRAKRNSAELANRAYEAAAKVKVSDPRWQQLQREAQAHWIDANRANTRAMNSVWAGASAMMVLGAIFVARSHAGGGGDALRAFALGAGAAVTGGFLVGAGAEAALRAPKIEQFPSSRSN